METAFDIAERGLLGPKPRRGPWRRALQLGAATALVCGMGYIAYRKWFRKDPPTIVFSPNRPESKVEGSEESPRLEPKSQMRIAYASKTGTIEVVGCGIRVQFGGRDYVMTASHNVATGEPIYLVGKGSSIELLKEPEVINCGYDIALIQLPNGVASKLGLSIANFCSLGTGDLYVDVVGANGCGTTGKLNPLPKSVGMLQYSGTTFGGYSGAAYFNGNSVYGIHTTGGRANMGVAAMFLQHAAKIALAMTDEAYDRSFYNKIMKQRTSHHNVTYLDDYAIVETQMGYYYRFPKEDFLRYANEAQQDEYLDEINEEEDEDFFVPENVNGVPLNSLRPAHTRAGRSSRQAVLVDRQYLEWLRTYASREPSTPSSPQASGSKSKPFWRAKKSTPRPTSPPRPS